MQTVFRRRKQGTERRNLRSLGQKDLRRQRNSLVPRYLFFFIAHRYSVSRYCSGISDCLSICHVVALWTYVQTFFSVNSDINIVFFLGGGGGLTLLLSCPSNGELTLVSPSLIHYTETTRRQKSNLNSASAGIAT